MGVLINHIRSILANREVQEHIDLITRAFCNHDTLYRSRNRRPRTDLMVKGLQGSPFSSRGLVAHAAFNEMEVLKANKPETDLLIEELSYERYSDIACYVAPWWTGERWCELLVEVENNWKELKGTLRDVLSSQARRKWAVFYSNDYDSAKDELRQAVNAVWRFFREQGFTESGDTEYEILVLPDYNSSQLRPLIGSEALVYDFTSTEAPLDSTPTVVLI